MSTRALALALTACAAAVVSGADIRPLQFTTDAGPAGIVFQRSVASDDYLTRLRTRYALDGLLEGATTDRDKVRAVSAWVHSRWQHDGSNRPAKNDPISILEEAAAGKRFRCVEYASVLSASLNAVGIPARVLGLMTADAATRKSGAGHVLVEAWLADHAKWMIIDPQWDAAAVRNGVPLNAVELQAALASHARDLRLDHGDRYAKWLAPYLFYFTLHVDQRLQNVEDRRQLILVPVGAPKITMFQRSDPIANAVFTSSLAVFYRAPQ
jgi:transglutaminase-like putative cysteine protease